MEYPLYYKNSNETLILNSASDLTRKNKNSSVEHLYPLSRPRKGTFYRENGILQVISSLIESMENGFIPHQAPPASKPRAIRASVIISNPAHRPQVTQASPNILPTTVEAPISESKSRSWDNLASMNDDAADEGADSDGSGIFNTTFCESFRVYSFDLILM